MLRNALAAGLAAALVAGLVAGLVGLLPAAPASANTSEYGHTAAPDRTLRSGCHGYRYRYVVKAPTNDWTLETFLIDPRDENLASNSFIAESDPRRGHGKFRFCRYSTRTGRFTIRAKLTWYNGSAEHVVRFKRSHFRLTRP